jgi:FKBP-type peptidyl-prolyl cis-trans isomerase
MKKLLALMMLCLLSNSGVALANEGVRLTTITDGDGPTPTASDTVRVHYRGTLVDGTEFDSSAKRGPATFSLSAVIPR